LFFEEQGSMHWEFDITDAVVFILREVLTPLPLESSGYQCQDGIKHPQQQLFLGDTQMILHILQGLKSSMYAKRGLKCLLLSH
jgi:hypothetical protein